MATYTNLTDWSGLQVGDVINYTTSGLSVNTKGFKFGCRLKGKGYEYRFSYVTDYSYGCNAYAEFDFMSVYDGNITLGNNYGSYIAITNGSGTDIRYNRIMVAGDAAPTAVGYSTFMGGNAGIFGGSGDNGNSWSGSYVGGGGMQNMAGSGYGTSATFGTCGINPSGSNGGNGWYGGGAGSSYGQYDRAYSGGGGSSYLLTDSSYKPDGYLAEWNIYQPLISNSSSSANISYIPTEYCTITILEVGGGSTRRTMKYYNGSTWVECNVNYYDGSEWIAVNPHYYDGSEWK